MHMMEHGCKKWVQWDTRELDESCVRALRGALSLTTLAARVLAARGIKDPQEAKQLLRCDLGALHDPFLMPDMDRACERIHAAMEKKEKIAIFGDYDVDGITSTYILKQYFLSYGVQCAHYIPDRIKEGYGVNLDAVNRLIDEGVTLIITVDTGITAHEAVLQAKARGCDMVITDHHECRDTLPEAVAVVNPHRADSKYPFPQLAGVGVTFKLICALDHMIAREYLPFVCIGTIADVVPLFDENRIIVSEGVSMIVTTRHTALRALLNAIGLSAKPLSTDHIGFAIAPRINAAGRMANASMVVDFLCERHADETEQAAQKLCDLNAERQAEERRILNEALALLPESYDAERDAAIVLAGEGWHHGVIGIVASRLCNRFDCPVILLSCEGELAKGSGRSVEGMNLYAAVSGASEYLLQYGGHEMAVGLTLRREDIPKLRAHVNACAKEQLAGYIPCITADLNVNASALTIEEIEGLSALAPFGAGNTPPLLYMRDARVDSITSMGKGQHLKFYFTQNNHCMEAVYFGKDGKDIDFTEGDIVDVLFRPEVNDFRGKSVQLVVRDIRPVESEIALMRKADELYCVVRQGIANEESALCCLPSYRELGAVWKVVERLLPKAEHGIPLVTIRRLTGGKIGYEKLYTALDVFCELGLLRGVRRGGSVELARLPVQGKADLEQSKILRDIALQGNGMMS